MVAVATAHSAAARGAIHTKLWETSEGCGELHCGPVPQRFALGGPPVKQFRLPIWVWVCVCWGLGQVSVIKVQLNSLSVSDMRAVANVRGISDMSIERLIEQVGALLPPAPGLDWALKPATHLCHGRARLPVAVCDGTGLVLPTHVCKDWAHTGSITQLKCQWSGRLSTHCVVF